MDSILTVTTAADSYDLTTRATVKSELGITNDASDDVLDRLIDQASRACAAYCNRVFAKETVQEVFRLKCRRDRLILRRRPVIAVTAVVEDGTTLVAADYESDADPGFLWRLDGADSRSTWAAAKITVTYSGGYTLLTNLPHDIEVACVKLVKALWFSRQRDPMIRVEEVPGVSHEEFWVNADAGALPADVTDLLDPYRDSIFG